jgi:hypothetical protein
MTLKIPFHKPSTGPCFRGCGTGGTKANRLPVVMEDTLVITDALPSEKNSSEWVYADWELVVPMVETECRSSRRLGRSGSGGRARGAFVVLSIPPVDYVPACLGGVKRFWERITLNMMIAGSEGMWAIIAAGQKGRITCESSLDSN